MRIAVFGATGMAGSAIVTEAVRRGHHVVALSRRQKSDRGQEQLTAQAADVADSDALAPVLAAVDAAVLTIRLPPGDESQLAPLTRGFLHGAARHQVPVLIVGGSAPLRSPTRPDRLVLNDPDYVPEAWKIIAGASLEQFRACREHPYRKWVYLSPPAVLEPGPRSGRYRRGTTTLLTDDNGDSRITAADLAVAVIDELAHAAAAERHFTVAQDSLTPPSRNR